MDADLTYLSSNFPGRLVELFVSRGQSVNKHQLLFKLEQTSEQFAVAGSELQQDVLISQKQELMNKLYYAETNYRRNLLMRKNNAASQNDLDLAKENLDVLKNQLTAIDSQIQSSRVDIQQKQWDVRRKENVAVDSGLIFDTYFTQGEYVQAGQPIVSLISPSHIKVVFFVPETDLNKIFLKGSVTISSDSEPSLAKGWISYISSKAQYTPPMIFSREESQALVFRVEAKIEAPHLNQLHLGQPVYLELER
ncbi:MAG: HlyD family efflux transporter periplasmic adaptor subunit [Legionellales bacterium]|nr:HlyD family efflux transporter periplasmic adaptor subunit [Legionellales bacterium]